MFAPLLCGILVLIIFYQWVSSVEIFTRWDIWNIFAPLWCGILVLIIFCQWVSPVEIFTGWDDGGARLASGCWRLGRPTQPIFKRKYFQWSDIFCWCLWFVHSRIGKHSHGVFTLYLAFTDVEHQEHLMKLIDWSFSSQFACWSNCSPTPKPTHPPPHASSQVPLESLHTISKEVSWCF